MKIFKWLVSVLLWGDAKDPEEEEPIEHFEDMLERKKITPQNFRQHEGEI
ncbi:MAG: hypothetical protein ACKKL4_00075 [Patescibacteria group bacterium]